MAGPTASVIVPESLDERSLGEVVRVIEGLADSVNGKEFVVSGSPFVWSHGEEYEGEFLECDYSQEIGWRTKDQILLIAMSNQSEDHRILAELCIAVSDQIGGLIDFGGGLRISKHLAFGILHRVEFESSGGGIGICHIGDVDFLQGWKTHPDFRMVK